MTTTETTAPVLDASALLAFLLEEPGREEVRAAIDTGAIVGAVNYAEVLTRLAEDVRSVEERESWIHGIAGPLLRVEPYLETDAIRAADYGGSQSTVGSRWATAPAWRLQPAWAHRS